MRFNLPVFDPFPFRTRHFERQPQFLSVGSFNRHASTESCCWESIQVLKTDNQPHLPRLFLTFDRNLPDVGCAVCTALSRRTSHLGAEEMAVDDYPMDASPEFTIRFRCPSCGKTIDAATRNEIQFLLTAWPECCDEVMTPSVRSPVGEEPAEVISLKRDSL